MSKTKKVNKTNQESDRELILEELETIRQANDGLLRAEDVVAFARNPRTALHKRFTWNDGEAAERFRLMQARSVIRVHVKIYPREMKRYRTYVSMQEDRQRGGGYRLTDEVLHVQQMRETLLYQANREMQAFIKRYEHLEELAGVIASMEGMLITEPKAALSGNLWVAGGLLLGSRFPQVRQVAQAIAKPVRALGEKLELVGKGVRTTPTV